MSELSKFYTLSIAISVNVNLQCNKRAWMCHIAYVTDVIIITLWTIVLHTDNFIATNVTFFYSIFTYEIVLGKMNLMHEWLTEVDSEVCKVKL